MVEKAVKEILKGDLKGSFIFDSKEEMTKEAFKAGGRFGYSQRSKMAGAKGGNDPDWEQWFEQNVK